jgi:hypothetical protein
LSVKEARPSLGGGAATIGKPSFGALHSTRSGIDDEGRHSHPRLTNSSGDGTAGCVTAPSREVGIDGSSTARSFLMLVGAVGATLHAKLIVQAKAIHRVVYTAIILPEADT